LRSDFPNPWRNYREQFPEGNSDGSAQPAKPILTKHGSPGCIALSRTSRKLSVAGMGGGLIGEWFALGILLGSNDRRIPRSILCRIAHSEGKLARGILIISAV